MQDSILENLINSMFNEDEDEDDWISFDDEELDTSEIEDKVDLEIERNSKILRDFGLEDEITISPLDMYGGEVELLSIEALAEDEMEEELRNAE